MATAAGKKYVVLAGALGARHHRGDLIDAEHLGENTDHLLASKSVRLATDEEAKLEKVTVVETSPGTQPYEIQLAEKEGEIDRLRSALGEAERKLNFIKSNVEPVKTDTASSKAAIELVQEKDKQIAELKKQLEERQAEGGKATAEQAKPGDKPPNPAIRHGHVPK